MVDIQNDDNWIGWVDRLSEDNYLIIDDFISQAELEAFKTYFKDQLAQDEFTKAGIGTQDQFQVNRGIRGDYIKWLNRGEDEGLSSFFERMDIIRQKLNRYCFLSLSGAEFHLAHYPPGTFYKRHLDQFSQRSNRLITVILYLNEDWQQGDGGELKAYPNKGEEVIAPLAKRLVLMRSNLVEHEVLVTKKDRYSITGWLLYQPVGLGFL